MKYFIYQPEEDGYLNRFITTGTYTRREEFEKVKLSGNVNEWLKKGFSIHENPCRKEFVTRRQGQVPPYLDLSAFTFHDDIRVFDQIRKLSVYYPFGSQGVDFSEFYYNPTYLRCYSFAYVFSEKEEKTEILLETCGGLTLWINDEIVTDFIPFTRNMKKDCIVQVRLKQGFNKMVVCLDDLAERDTDFYFRIRYMGKERLKLCLPVDDSVDVEAMEKIEQELSQIFFERETYMCGPVELNFKNPLDRSLRVTASYKPVADKISNPEKLVTHKSWDLGVGERKIALFSAEDVIPGFYFIKVSAGVDGIQAERTIATQVFHEDLLYKKSVGDSTIKIRKLEAIRYLEEYEVENVYKAAAIFAAGGDVDYAERIIVEELEGIRSRKDCSDFHLIVVEQILKLFGGKLSDNTREAVREVILGFRYWIDEPGNDVMWFFSENHALLFHICQYYAGRLYPDDVFTNSGLTGKEQAEKAEVLLEEWFTKYFEEFITEWNSNAYIPVDVLGLCGLYNLAEEGNRWQVMAGKALDRIFKDLAVNEHKGVVMTTFGRSYEKETKGNYTAGTTSLLYIAYGAGYLNRAALAYISFVLGSYEPPCAYERFIGIGDGQELIYEKTQGYEKHVNLYHYKNSRVQLSTAVLFHPFTPGYQEHIMQAALDPLAQMYVNHPGEVQPYGNGRPNYWAGNGSLPLAVQYENLGIMVFRIPENHPVKFTHAYVPLMEFDGYMGTEDTVVAEKDGGYLGVRALNGLRIRESGPCRGREFISYGLTNIWLVKVGTVSEYGSLSNFCTELSQTEICRKDGEELSVKDRMLGRLSLSRSGFLVEGIPVYDYPVSSEGIITWKNREKKRGEV